MTWNADNPGFDPGSLLFLEAESWACQVAEIVVPVAGKLVAHTAENAGPAAGNVVQGTVGEGQVTEMI